MTEPLRERGLTEGSRGASGIGAWLWRGRYLLFSALTAFLLLLFCSRSSFLFPCNNWDDVNSYFTMGKGMMNGMVIYRDLYDQKGPYLYLLYGIGYLLSRRSFDGIFILEVIAGTGTLYFLLRILRLYLEEGLACALLPFLAAAMFISRSFWWGGAAEEFFLPFLACSLYELMNYLKDRATLQPRDLCSDPGTQAHNVIEDPCGPSAQGACGGPEDAAQGALEWVNRYPREAPCRGMLLRAGLFCGIIFQVKYTGIGFYFGFMALLVVLQLLRRDLRGLWLTVGRFLLAFALPSLPWLLYFAGTGALDDYWRCYFYNNLFFYSDISDEASHGLLSLAHFYTVGKILYWRIQEDASYFVFVLAGFLGFLLAPRRSVWERLAPLWLFGCVYYFLSIGETLLTYYSIPLMIFAVFGFVVLGEILRAGRERIGGAGVSPTGPRWLFLVTAGSCLSAAALFAALATPNRNYRALPREELFLFRFRDTILSDDKEHTLFNAQGLDCGLYTLTGIVPTCEYFQKNGIGLPAMDAAQSRYIHEGRTRYIVSIGEPDVMDHERYEQIDEETYGEYTYYLYRRIGDG